VSTNRTLRCIKLFCLTGHKHFFTYHYHFCYMTSRTRLSWRGRNRIRRNRGRCRRPCSGPEEICCREGGGAGSWYGASLGSHLPSDPRGGPLELDSRAQGMDPQPEGVDSRPQGGWIHEAQGVDSRGSEGGFTASGCGFTKAIFVQLHLCGHLQSPIKDPSSSYKVVPFGIGEKLASSIFTIHLEPCTT
jgi:hypothetical protein